MDSQQLRPNEVVDLLRQLDGLLLTINAGEMKASSSMVAMLTGARVGLLVASGLAAEALP